MCKLVHSIFVSSCDTHLFASSKSATMLAKDLYCEVLKIIVFVRGSKLQIFSYDRNKPIDFERQRETS